MTRQTFTWFPEWEASLSQTPQVQVTKFGDGYEARVARGMDNNPETWSLQFTMAAPQLTEIVTFIQARGGVESFIWTTPMSNTGIYVCRKWKTTHRGGIRIMNFDLEQVFEF